MVVHCVVFVKGAGPGHAGVALTDVDSPDGTPACVYSLVPHTLANLSTVVALPNPMSHNVIHDLMVAGYAVTYSGEPVLPED